MASSTTIADITTQVRYLIGDDPTKEYRRWSSDEILSYVESALITVINDLPIQSVPELHQVADGVCGVISVVAPADFAKLIVLSIKEDSFYIPWDKVTQSTFYQIKACDYGVTLATTDTRIFTEADDNFTMGSLNTYLLHPPSVGTELYQLRYVSLPDITGTMYLPTEYVNFEEMWVLKSAEIALVKKAHDLELSTHFHNLYNEKLELVRAKHGNI